MVYLDSADLDSRSSCSSPAAIAPRGRSARGKFEHIADRSMASRAGAAQSNDVVTPYPKTFIESMQTWPPCPTRGHGRSSDPTRQKNLACQFTTTGEGTAEGRPAVGLRMKPRCGTATQASTRRPWACCSRKNSASAASRARTSWRKTSTGIIRPATASPSPASRRTSTTEVVLAIRELVEFQGGVAQRAATAKPDRSPARPCAVAGTLYSRTPWNRIPKGAIDVEPWISSTCALEHGQGRRGGRDPHQGPAGSDTGRARTELAWWPPRNGPGGRWSTFAGSATPAASAARFLRW